MSRANTLESILASLDRSTECWLRTKGIEPTGYSQVRWGEAHRLQMTHRVVYEALVGPVPEGLVLHHKCRVRNCCNPAHLEPVTFAENILMGESPTAQNARKTHCSRGHELTPENVVSCYSDRRECRICWKIWQADSYRRRTHKRDRPAPPRP